MTETSVGSRIAPALGERSDRSAADRSAAEVIEIAKQVRRVKAAASRLVDGALAGSYRSVFRGAGIEFDEVREYVEGDDPRRVDWNVTARVGRPFVKSHVEERERSAFFLVDVSASMDSGFGERSLRQVAARACAALGLAAVKNGDQVGLIAFDDAVVRAVPPDKGARHALRLVYECLTATGAARRSDPRAAIERLARVARRRAIVFLISDFQFDGAADALAVCARRHDVIAVHLLPSDLTAPLQRAVRLRDPEGGAARVVDWRDAGLRRAFAAQVDEFRARTAAELRRAAVDRIEIAVGSGAADVVSRPLMAFFRARERRGLRR